MRIYVLAYYKEFRAEGQTGGEIFISEILGKPNQLLPKSDNVQKKQPLNQMRKIDGVEISRDKIVIGITEKAGQDLGRQNSNHCSPKTDMARKDQRQKEAGRTNDIVGFIVKQLVAAFFFFHIHTLSSILKTIHPYS